MSEQEERDEIKVQRSEDLRARSGRVNGTDPLMAFFYTLLRDEFSAGGIEDLVEQSLEAAGKGIEYTNGYLVSYARDLAQRFRLREEPTGNGAGR